MTMIELIGFGIFFICLALCAMIRLAKGPTPADRMVAGDAADNLI